MWTMEPRAPKPTTPQLSSRGVLTRFTTVWGVAVRKIAVPSPRVTSYPLWREWKPSSMARGWLTR